MKRPEVTSAASAADFGAAVQERLLQLNSASHIRWHGLRDRFTFGTLNEFVDTRWNSDTYFSEEDKTWIIARYIQLRLER